MKKVCIFLLAAFVVTIAFGQDKTRARVIFMKVKNDMTLEFEKGLVAHMAKYHPKATDPVTIYSVMSGHHSGEYHYVQGGLNWGDLEGKQYPADHREDWMKNCGKYITSSELHYYNYQAEYSNNVTQEESNWAIVSFVTLNPGYYGTYLNMMTTRKKAMEKAKDARSIAVYSHSFSGRDSEHHFVHVADLKAGLKELDTNQDPFFKILNEQVSPFASSEWSRDADNAIKKVETMLVRRMANLSSK